MNDCGISKLDLKRRNRMQILKVVRENGPISRVDISSLLGITRAAVTIPVVRNRKRTVFTAVGSHKIASVILAANINANEKLIHKIHLLSWGIFDQQAFSYP